MNRAHKGRRNEYRSKAVLLEAHHGHADDVEIIRSAASKGRFDLAVLCCRCGTVTAIQVKSNGWPGQAELVEIKRFVGAFNDTMLGAEARPWVLAGEVHRWDDRVACPQRITFK